MKSRIYLSPPHISHAERELVADAFDSNWIAPLGPHVTAFEKEICSVTGAEYACALSSGTAGIHLALLLLGVKKGDEVYCSSLTFAASANAIVYTGATPVFIDSDYATWNMDPLLLEYELETANRYNRLPKAVIVVDLYGQCADYEPILEVCNRYDVPVIEDAAEALGASYRGRKAGTFGEMAVLSFNGNKIITTSGGGMLLSSKEKLIIEALHLATQARDKASHYEHSVIGYNYRMSNVLAAIGRGQLLSLEQKVAARRRNFDIYEKTLGGLRGIMMMPETPNSRSNRWLSCLIVDPEESGVTSENIRLHLEKKNIECRPVWKPMHMQPVFQECRFIGRGVSEKLFEKGLCLPSGSSLTDSERDYIVSSIKELLKCFEI